MSDEQQPKPISDAQLKANRENALKCTGPRTPEGKLRVSRNAVKHGILARKDFLLNDGEPVKEWLRFRRRIISELRPVGEMERFFCEKIVWAMWRHRRLYNAERTACDGQFNDESGKAVNQRIDLGMRYERSLENSIRKSMEMLAACQKARLRNAKTISAHDLVLFGEALVTEAGQPEKSEVEGASGNTGEGESPE